MNNKQIAKRLGYNTVADMFKAHGYSAVLFHKLKEDNKEIKLNDIILKHYGINTSDLLNMIESINNIGYIKTAKHKGCNIDNHCMDTQSMQV